MSKVWVTDKEFGWWLGEIQSESSDGTISYFDLKGETFTSVRKGNDHTLKVSSKSNAHYCHLSHLEDLDDLCLMNNLHEAPLLHILMRRLSCEKIYTNAGNVLVSMNPYKPMDTLYDSPLNYLDIEKYNSSQGELPVSLLSIPFPSASSSASPPHSHLGSSIADPFTPTPSSPSLNQSPHVYNIANCSLRALMGLDNGNNQMTSAFIEGSSRHSLPHRTISNQSVVISGESGAGKTEAARRVLNFFIAANGHLITNARNKEMGSETSKLIMNRKNDLSIVLQNSNIILEAFGNAKTTKNDNSSRFGKFTKLQYTEDNVLVAAVTETFLLEKSRVVNTNMDERNYHIFYQLLSGINSWDANLASDLQLTSLDSFGILFDAKHHNVENEDDGSKFLQLCNALESITCSREEIRGVFSLLGAILHMGNMKFSEKTPPPATTATSAPPSVDDSGMVGGMHHLSQVDLSSMPMDKLSQLLGLNTQELVSAIVTQKLVVNVARRSSIKIKTLSPEEAKYNVWALQKWLYEKIFLWILAKINVAHSSTTPDLKIVKFIGILDIFGFEILDLNSLEQLCINYTNERLQEQFNQVVFVAEKEYYMTEGLSNWQDVTYTDNRHLIELIAYKPHGLLPILEEHSLLNRRPDDLALLASYNQIHLVGTAGVNGAYSLPRFGENGFIIKHFAGEVTYTIDGFLLKNNDSLQEDLMDLMHLSTNTLLTDIIKSTHMGSKNLDESLGQSQNARKLAATVTVSNRFRHQLDDLMGELENTQPRYIKCIKPNSHMAALTSEPKLCLDQLRYLGLLEVVRIRREGFPIRMEFIEFYKRYELIMPANRTRARSAAVMKESLRDEQKIREHSITLASENLQSHQFQAGSRFMFLQATALADMDKKMEELFHKHAVCIQSSWRRTLARNKYLALKAIHLPLIQSIARMRLQRRRYKEMRRAAYILQHFYYGCKRFNYGMDYMRTVIQNRKRQIVKIQSMFRMIPRRNEYMTKKYACIILQCAIRRFIALREMKARKRAFEELKERTRRENSSAVILQSYVRMMLARKSFQQKKSNILLLQAAIRRSLAQRQYAKVQTAIVRIQSAIRMRKAYSTLSRQKDAVTSVSAMVRMMIAKRRLKSQKTAAVLIQSVMRSRIALKKYNVCTFAICKLQAWARMLIQYRRFRIIVFAVVTIQSTMRMTRAKMLFHRMKKAVILLQSHARKMVAMRHLSTALYATITMQAFTRCVVQRKKYINILFSTVSIQTLGRMIIARRQFHKTMMQLILVQSLIRRFLSIIQKRKLKAAYMRLFKCLHSFLRNRSLKLNLITFYRACISGDLVVIKAKQRAIPDYRILRNRWNKMCTLFETILGSDLRLRKSIRREPKLESLISGVNSLSPSLSNNFSSLSYSTLKILSPQPHEVVRSDCEGSGALHYLCDNSDPCMSNLLLLSDCLDRCRDFDLEWLDEDDEEEDMDNEGSEWLQEDEQQRKEAAMNLRKTIAYYDVTKPSKREKGEAAPTKLKKIPTTCKAPTSISDAVKWGWLRKKRDKNNYKTRFAVLTSLKIMYFKSDEDLRKPRGVVPIQGCTVERVPGKDPIIEVISPLMVSKFTIFGKAKKRSMYFFFDSEKDLQEWLIPLKLMANGVKKIRDGPVVYLDVELRRQWISEKNNHNQTPLHILASSLGGGLTDVEESVRNDYLLRKNDSENLLWICAWLVNCGCPIDEVDENNETALHIAINNKLWNLALCLIRLGASLAITNREGVTALKRIQTESLVAPPSMQTRFHELLSLKSSSSSMLRPHLSAPPYLFEYSYLMLRLMKHTFGGNAEGGAATGHLQLPEDSFLSISLYDSKNDLVEDVQDINLPAVNQASQTWWGKTWHMQTPLQNIEPGSFIIISLHNSRELTDVDSPWIRYDIDKETINSGIVNLQWRKRGGKGLMPDSIPNGETDGSSLEFEVVIPLKAKSIDINLLRRM